MANRFNGVQQFAPRRTREEINKERERKHTRGRVKSSSSKRYENATPGSSSEKRRHPKRCHIGGAVDGATFSVIRRWGVEVWTREDVTIRNFAPTRRAALRLPHRVEGSNPVLTELPGRPAY